MPPCRNAVYELMSEDGLDRKGNSLRNIVNFSDRVRAAAEATQSRRWFVDLPACSHNAASHPTARVGYLTNVLTPWIARLESRAWSGGSVPKAGRVGKVSISTLTCGDLPFDAEPC